MSEIDKIIDLLKQNKTPQQELADYLGINKSVISAWKSGDNKSYNKYIPQIAQFFNVPTSYFYDTLYPESGNIESLTTSSSYMIPVYRSVSAGFGAYAQEEIIDYLPLMINNPHDVKDTLCIKVVGDSMYPKIEDGDIIQVHKQDDVDSGSIAVVTIKEFDEIVGFVKKVIKGTNYIELHSFNPDPIYRVRRFDGAELENVKILGLVQRIIRDI